MDLCLNMIVKDEAGEILETLTNVCDYFPLASWLIHDTGSSDATPDLIRQFFQERNLPGKLIFKPWENFGANRQYALADTLGLSEFVLFFDADNRITGEKPKLSSEFDALTLNMQRGGIIYPAKLIVRNGAYRWRGVVHEGLYPTGPHDRVGHVSGDYVVDSRRAGARSRDAATYYKDAQILAGALQNLAKEDEDLRSRYTFYCANSWRDAKVPREAVYWYRERIRQGGWKDEVYMSHHALGLELMKLGSPDEAQTEFLRGYELRPDRAECLYHLTKALREQGKYHSALLFAKEGTTKSLPESTALFVWSDIYRFWMDYEYLSCLKSLGRLNEGAEAFARMRSNGAPPHLLQAFTQ